MRALFVLWVAPLVLFWGWFFLSLNDIHAVPRGASSHPCTSFPSLFQVRLRATTIGL